MTGMATIQARLDEEIAEELAGLVQRLGWSRSRVMREAIRVLAAIHPPKRRPRISGIGEFKSGVPDLGSNKAHLKGFGR
jgi:metal-responsive CopG/Arc/MetJ family transcriptional regulator